MDIRFVAQPFRDGEDLRDFFEAVAKDEDLKSLRIAVAWAKRSGLARIERAVAALHARGGRLLAVVGISEGGGTRQGMELLIALADEAHVFHDSGRTFHPKVYLASGDRAAKLMVGSQNLTLGGLAWNYEAAVVCELDLTVQADAALHQQVLDYFERLREDEDVCLVLDDARLAALLADPALQIRDEDDRHRGSLAEAQGEDVGEADEELERAAARIFGHSREPKRPIPPLAPAPSGGGVGTGTQGGGGPSGSGGGVGTPAPANPGAAHRWFKVMDGTAAQRPPSAASKPTGNLRLSQEHFAIDHTRYFRRVFFGDETWTSRPSDPRFEDSTVPMHVEVDGDYLGVIDMRVSHAEHRISGQGNVPTVLHWGDQVGPLMRAGDFVGRTVTLERSGSGAFRLTIDHSPTGPFVF